MDPRQQPEQALDAAEENVLGTTADQERDDENDRAPDDPDAPPEADEPSA